MHDYLLKWRGNPDQRTLRIIAPQTLMNLSGPDWRMHVAAQVPTITTTQPRFLRIIFCAMTVAAIARE
jgi:hypothetical protein